MKQLSTRGKRSTGEVWQIWQAGQDKKDMRSRDTVAGSRKWHSWMMWDWCSDAANWAKGSLHVSSHQPVVTGQHQQHCWQERFVSELLSTIITNVLLALSSSCYAVWVRDCLGNSLYWYWHRLGRGHKQVSQGTERFWSVILCHCSRDCRYTQSLVRKTKTVIKKLPSTLWMTDIKYNSMGIHTFDHQ